MEAIRSVLHLEAVVISDFPNFTCHECVTLYIKIKQYVKDLGVRSNTLL